MQPYQNIYYDFRDEEERIRILQEMLRFISRQTGDESLSVAVDGSYDRATANAVRAFQRKYSLSETGEVDFATWQKIREVYALYYSDSGAGGALYPFTDAHGAVRLGEKSSLVLILQIMLESVRIFFGEGGEIPLSGVYDQMTEEAIRIFQRANLLDVTGVTDKRTWDRLAEAYNFAERERQ